MEHLLRKPSEVCDLMPCKLQWHQVCDGWIFLSELPNDELEYQRTISPIMSAAHVIPSSKRVLWADLFYWNLCPSVVSLVQLWVPIKVDGWTFLSIADQPFLLNDKLDKRLCSYRRLCVNTLIPIDKYYEEQLGPPGRVFRRLLPEYNPDVPSYSAAEFPLLENAIRSGIHSYYAYPVFESINDQQCYGVYEVVCTEPFLRLPRLIKLRNTAGFGEIKMGLNEILKIHSLPFAQIWIPSEYHSLKVLSPAGASSYDHSNIIHIKFEYVSEVCPMERGKALVGKAFVSQGSCFCKDVTLLSLQEYPLVPIARKAGLTQSFAICLRSKCTDNVVCVIEYFLPPHEMVVRGIETFLSMLLSTMKEQLPGVIVASGQELGQRMLVEVVKVSLSDELDSFEIGQPPPSVQSLQDGGETSEIDFFWQQSNLQNGENNVDTALLVPYYSSHKCDSLNCEGTVEVDPLLPRPIVEAVANRGLANVDVAHDDHIEFEKDTGESMQPDSHFEQSSVETDSTGNAGSNDKLEHNDISRCLPVVEAEAINENGNFTSGAATSIQKTDSHNNEILRIEKDHGITCEKIKQQFGKSLKDAAKTLSVSPSTLKRICRKYKIFRWPHPKTRKAYHNFSQGISLQGAELYVGDQQCPNLSQEKGTNCNEHKRSHSKGKPCNDSLMSVKVTYRDDIIKFKLTPSATMVELQGEVEKRLNISLQRFSIKYQDEDDEWVTITGDSDLREGMHEIRLLGRTTMKLVVTPKSEGFALSCHGSSFIAEFS